MYKIATGTQGKLIKILPNQEPEIVDWTTRKSLAFPESLTSANVLKEIMTAKKKPLALRMHESGYALFGGESGGDRTANYVLAIPYKDIVSG